MTTGIRSHARVVCGAALLGAIAASGGAAQGTAVVSGQVTILERPGETTEDLGDVVVYLEPLGAAVRAKVAAPAANSVMNLQKRQFSPRVSVILQGGRVEFPNLDPFSHNVFSKANGGFDTGVYGRGKTRDNTFQEPGIYPLYCNVHPRMTAYVVTLVAPWYTQAGLDGRFAIENVPVGRYVLHVWHDRATSKEDTVVVGAAGLRNQRIALDARAYKYVQHKNKFGQDYTSAGGDRY